MCDSFWLVHVGSDRYLRESLVLPAHIVIDPVAACCYNLCKGVLIVKSRKVVPNLCCLIPQDLFKFGWFDLLELCLHTRLHVVDQIWL